MKKVDTSALKPFHSSGKELAGVLCHVYTQTAGLMGSMGHNLKLAVKEFTLFFDVAEKKLKVGVFKAESVEVEYAVDAQKNQELKKTVSESDKETINRNLHSKDVLHVDQFPEVAFQVTKETKNSVEGVLHLHGASNKIRLAIEEFPEHFAVKTMVNQPQFGIAPYSAMMGSLKVAPQVDVEVIFPKAVYNDGAWWF